MPGQKTAGHLLLLPAYFLMIREKDPSKSLAFCHFCLIIAFEMTKDWIRVVRLFLLQKDPP